MSNAMQFAVRALITILALLFALSSLVATMSLLRETQRPDFLSTLGMAIGGGVLAAVGLRYSNNQFRGGSFIFLGALLIYIGCHGFASILEKPDSYSMRPFGVGLIFIFIAPGLAFLGLGLWRRFGKWAQSDKRLISIRRALQVPFVQGAVSGVHYGLIAIAVLSSIPIFFEIFALVTGAPHNNTMWAMVGLIFSLPWPGLVATPGHALPWVFGGVVINLLLFGLVLGTYSHYQARRNDQSFKTLFTRSRIGYAAAIVAIVSMGYWGATLWVSHTSLVRTVKQWQPLKNHPAKVAFSRDGTMMAVSNVLSKDVRIYSVPDFQLIRTIGKAGEALAISFAPDNKTLAVGSHWSRLAENRNSIRLWDIRTGEALWEPPGFIAGTGAENNIQALTFDPEGKSLLASLYGTNEQGKCCYLYLIDLETKAVKSFGTSTARTVAFSPNGDRIAEGGYDQVRMWSATGDGLIWEQTIQRSKMPNRLTQIDSVAFSPDGSRLLVSADYAVTIHSSADGQLQKTLPVTPKYPQIMASYSPNGKYIVVAGEQLWILDAQSLVVLEESELPRSAGSLSFSPTGHLFAVGTGRGHVVVKELVTH